MLLHAGLGKEFFFGLRFQAEFFSEPLEQFDPMIIEHIIIGYDIIIFFFCFGSVSTENAFSHNYLQ